MWPLRKKKELPKLIRLTPTQVQKILLSSRKPCPRNDCDCHDCPSRGMCQYEYSLYSSGACFMDNPMSPRVKDVIGLGCGCSWKKHLKGELNEEKKRDTESGRVIPCNATDGGDFYGFGQISTEGGRDEQ